MNRNLARATAAARLLNSLGSSQAIAKHFEDNGIMGVPGVSEMCPVANYIRRRTGVPVAVFNNILAFNEFGAPSSWTPLHVFEFVKDFDADYYPILDSRWQD